jgi:hypothetical protein
MRRIGILTAGGDTPALNAAIHGAVVRANQLKIEVYGLIKGFNCLFNPRVPHVHLNPLFQEVPELDPTKGGTLIGSSRDYVDPERQDELDLISSRLKALGIEGLIAVGGEGTLTGLQPLTEREVWTSGYLGMHAKPVVLLDPYGHYTGLLDWVRGLRDRGFVVPAAIDRLIVTTDVDAALDACATEVGDADVSRMAR